MFLDEKLFNHFLENKPEIEVDDNSNEVWRKIQILVDGLYKITDDSWKAKIKNAETFRSLKSYRPILRKSINSWRLFVSKVETQSNVWPSILKYYDYEQALRTNSIIEKILDGKLK